MAAEGTASARSVSSTWPIIMAFIRLALFALGAVVILGLYRLFPPANGEVVGYPVTVLWNTVTVAVANVTCLALLWWRFKEEGLSWRSMIGFSRSTVIRDLASGLGIALALFVPLAVGSTLAFLAIERSLDPDVLAAALGAETELDIVPPTLPIIVGVIAFPLLNPLVEELQYRGYVQQQLMASTGSVRIGAFVSALGFGLHHAAFGLTATSAAAYTAGFIAWGLAASYVAHKMRRLFPLMVAHFVSNAPFGVVPLFYL